MELVKVKAYISLEKSNNNTDFYIFIYDGDDQRKCVACIEISKREAERVSNGICVEITNQSF